MEPVEERVYTVPLQKAWAHPRLKRTPRAVRILKEFVQKHMKSDKVLITNEVNEKLWERSVQKPPRRIRIKAVKDSEGVVTVYLAES
jgi:large subunit ribosomal protein L31e